VLLSSDVLEEFLDLLELEFCSVVLERYMYLIFLFYKCKNEGILWAGACPPHGHCLPAACAPPRHLALACCPPVYCLPATSLNVLPRKHLHAGGVRVSTTWEAHGRHVAGAWQARSRHMAGSWAHAKCTPIWILKGWKIWEEIRQENLLDFVAMKIVIDVHGRKRVHSMLACI